MYIPDLHMSASQYLSSSSLSSDSVGSIIRHPATGKDMVGAWKPAIPKLNTIIKHTILCTQEGRSAVYGYTNNQTVYF